MIREINREARIRYVTPEEEQRREENWRRLRARARRLRDKSEHARGGRRAEAAAAPE